MRTLGPAEQTLLNRLAIDPHLRQAELANELGVTRSAVNQVWNRLEAEFQLRVRGNVDYGKLGLHYIFGWAQSTQEDENMDKFWSWLQAYPFTILAKESAMTSTMDKRVYYEILLPTGDSHHWFVDQLRRFQKEPYNLTLFTENVDYTSNHLNIGLFDGTNWDFNYDFRIEASMDVAKDFADVLPITAQTKQSTVSDLDWNHIPAARQVESHYYATSTSLAQKLEQLDLPVPSERTLRRRLAYVRDNIAEPYITLSNIGLEQEVVVCVREFPSRLSFSRLLQAQGRTFPRTRVVSGSQLDVIHIGIPKHVDWVSLSASITALSSGAAEICTFITDCVESKNVLETILSKKGVGNS